MTQIFVYGTLKRKYHNNVLLSDSKFIREATTKPLYLLYDCGPFPCLIKAPNGKGKAIFGEVFEVDDVTMKRLDRLEGVPHLYQRGDMELENGDKVIAYFFQEDVSDFVECGQQWPIKK